MRAGQPCQTSSVRLLIRLKPPKGRPNNSLLKSCILGPICQTRFEGLVIGIATKKLAWIVAGNQAQNWFGKDFNPSLEIPFTLLNSGAVPRATVKPIMGSLMILVGILHVSVLPGYAS